MRMGGVHLDIARSIIR